MKAYLRRGQINMKLKNFEETLKDFEKVKSMDTRKIILIQ
jgi:hypothetical protein